MESPLKRLANISGSSRAIAVAEAHRAHEAKAEAQAAALHNGEYYVAAPVVPKKARPRPLVQTLRQASPTKPKKLSRDMSVRVAHLNGPTASDRAKRAEEKRRRKAEARLGQ